MRSNYLFIIDTLMVAVIIACVIGLVMSLTGCASLGPVCERPNSLDYSDVALLHNAEADYIDCLVYRVNRATYHNNKWWVIF